MISETFQYQRYIFRFDDIRLELLDDLHYIMIDLGGMGSIDKHFAVWRKFVQGQANSCFI